MESCRLHIIHFGWISRLIFRQLHTSCVCIVQTILGYWIRLFYSIPFHLLRSLLHFWFFSFSFISPHKSWWYIYIYPKLIFMDFFLSFGSFCAKCLCALQWSVLKNNNFEQKKKTEKNEREKPRRIKSDEVVYLLIRAFASHSQNGPLRHKEEKIEKNTDFFRQFIPKWRELFCVIYEPVKMRTARPLAPFTTSNKKWSLKNKK